MLVVTACSPAALPPVSPAASPLPPVASPGTGAAAGSLTALGVLRQTRAAHSATVLPDGRVLVAGGCVEDSCEGITAESEILDPATGQTVAGPAMQVRRVGHTTVALPDGRILFVGGFGERTVERTTELFDPATETFVAGPALGSPRAGATTVLLDDGTVLVAAGFDGDSALSTAEILDPETDTVRPTGGLATARSGQVGALLPDGRVLVVGGSSGAGERHVLASAEVYDSETGLWSAVGDMGVRRHKHAAVALDDGKVLIVGGSDERDGHGRYRSAELFDPLTGQFAAVADLAAARYKIVDAALRLPDGRVLVAGGAPAAEVFDPTGNRWLEVAGDAGAGYSFAAAVVVADGSVIVIGGYDDRIALTDQILRYSP